MNTVTTIRGQVCPNIRCEFHGKSGRGNVVIHSQEKRRFRCNMCGKTWVIYSNEPYFGIRTDNKEKFFAAAKFIAQGLSVRKTAMRVHVNSNTVQRWKKRIKNTDALWLPSQILLGLFKKHLFQNFSNLIIWKIQKKVISESGTFQ